MCHSRAVVDAQVRSIVLGALYGAVFSIIVHKLNLTTGVIPSLGMSIALINFFTVKLWNGVLCKLNFDTLPFSPQVPLSVCSLTSLTLLSVVWHPEAHPMPVPSACLDIVYCWPASPGS